MLDNVNKTHQKFDHSKSLFAQKSVRGWWPCYLEKDGKKELGVCITYTMPYQYDNDKYTNNIYIDIYNNNSSEMKLYYCFLGESRDDTGDRE